MQELNKSQRAEVVTDDATVILRRAIKLAQQGFVVSVGPPQRQEEQSEQQKSAVEQVARERNSALGKQDPVRPFLSSVVAGSLASQLITLLHTLVLLSTPLITPVLYWFTVQASSPLGLWAEAIASQVEAGLARLRRVAEARDLIATDSQQELVSLYTEARKVLAVLAVLGAHQVSLE